MKRPIIHYDTHSDTLFIATRPGPEERCVEIVPGVNIELGPHGEVIGIEILNASKVLRSVSKLETAKA